MGNTLQKTNNQLTTAFKNNDQKVMQQVYQQIFPKFRSHVLKNSGDENQAKDVFQEAFVNCWQNVKEDKLATNSNLEAYLFTIAKNKWIDHLRSMEFKKTVKMDNLSRLTIVQDEPENDHKVTEQQDEIMKKALDRLGANCKLLLQLFYFDRKSMHEISRLMEIAPASARNQKYRCMEKLRNLSLKIKQYG